MASGIAKPELTPEQVRLKEFSPSGHLLVRGEAGSGKTTVLAARAGYLLSDLFKGRLLFLTYNDALAEYVKNLLVTFDCIENVDIFTLHGWAGHFYETATDRRPEWIGGETQRTAIITAIKQDAGTRWTDNHLLTAENDFWSDEIKWIFGQGIKNLQSYKSRPRAGRGTAITVRGDDYDFVWEVFSKYKSELQRKGLFDYDDILGMVRAAMPVNKDGKRYFSESLQYDHVCIDEVQDFHLSWLVAISPIAKQSLTLAGDLGQKIYRRNFTWKDAGINVVGRAYSIRGSFRTTKQIMQVAVYLALNEDVKGEDYVEPTIPKREGSKVLRIRRNKFWEARDAAVQQTAELWRARSKPSERVVLAAQFSKSAEKLKSELSKHGIPVRHSRGIDLVTAEDCVAVTTFHQLKGLEFDHVVVSGLEDETMPQFWIKLQHSEKPVEAEQFLRRLVYVAMTRAKKTVVIAGGEPFCRFFRDIPVALFHEC